MCTLQYVELAGYSVSKKVESRPHHFSWKSCHTVPTQFHQPLVQTHLTMQCTSSTLYTLMDKGAGFRVTCAMSKSSAALLSGEMGDGEDCLLEPGVFLLCFTVTVASSSFLSSGSSSLCFTEPCDIALERETPGTYETEIL